FIPIRFSVCLFFIFFFFSSRRRHTRCYRDWSSDVCSSDLVPRDAHGDWQPAPDRPDPVEVLVAQGESRVPELLPIRYGRMAESEIGRASCRERVWMWVGGV